MRRFALVMVAGVTTLLALHGCGLSVVGFDDQPTADASASVPFEASSASDVASPRDSSLFTPNDAAGTACGCALVAPAGWTLVAYGDRGTPCTGDLKTLDLVADPVGGSCACSCTATLPTCPGTQWAGTYDETVAALCNQVSSNKHTITANCLGDDGYFVNHVSIAPIAPQGGSCTPVTEQKPPTTTAVRVCQPSGTTCACDPSLGPNRTTCLAANGDQPCPASAPKKHLVGAAVAPLECGACSCTTTTGCRQTATFYSDSNCQNAMVSTASDTCTASTNGANFRSIRYKLEPQAGCTPGVAPAAPAPALTETSTGCCP